MGVSPSQVKSKKGKDICPEESTSEEAIESRSDLLPELSEDINQCGYAITKNESAEIGTGISYRIHEPSSEHVAKNSLGEHLGLLPRGASEHISTHKSFCPPETVSGTTHGCGSKYVHKEKSEMDQLSVGIVQNKHEETCSLVIGLPANHEQPLSEDLSKNGKSVLPKDSSKYVQNDKVFCPQLGSVEPTVGFDFGNTCKELGEPSEQWLQFDSESLINGIEKSTTAVFINVCSQAMQLNPEDLSQKNGGQHLQLPYEGVGNNIQTSKSPFVDPLKLPQEFASGNFSIEQSRLHCKDMTKNSGTETKETTPKKLSKSSGPPRVGNTSKAIKKKYMLRSLTSSDRVLRSKLQEKSKAVESSNNLSNVGSIKQQKKRKSKKRREKREVSDEFSKIRSHLRYLLNRINYEQSLIAAYSAEGWKGLSLEKLKPEKELQRATSEILRRKLKIRDLFQRIDLLCAEGRLPESLFDSEGQIDSEDIFCAKCGSKDLPVNNDIILCDGFCDRGFHQYCLQPPLLREDIPPGDESWLCPGCDCKVDCIELVNESQGTSFSLSDSWEKVFIEAALAAAGKNPDPNFGLPSDDSDDNDYNPDGSETDEKDQGDESSSDESDFTSISEELQVPANVDPYAGLPLDDSEDDDYDPDVADPDNVAKPESSSSDFTSDSEDLGAMVQDDISSQNAKGPTSNSASKDSKRRKPKLGRKDSLNDELLSIMEQNPGQYGDAVSKKRSIERLDYKMLYDETYGNIPSSSSDDEDYSDTAAPKRRKKHTVEPASAAVNGNASANRSVSVSDGLNLNSEAPRKKTRRNSKFQDTNLSPAELQRCPSISYSSGKKAGSSTYKRLGEAEKQRLYKIFEENHYPDRAAKESLAKELDMTFQQVSKWFENARVRFNNSASVKETTSKKVSKKDVTSARSKKK